MKFLLFHLALPPIKKKQPSEIGKIKSTFLWGLKTGFARNLNLRNNTG